MPDEPDGTEQNPEAPFQDMIPEGGTFMHGLLMVTYMTEEGEILDHYRIIGEPTMRDTIGTLESNKFRIQCRAYGIEIEGWQDEAE